jgi:hypothetical protein
MRLLSWKHFRAIEPDREYVALFSEIPLRSYRAFARFLPLARRIFRQLKVARGLVGYSVNIHYWQKQFCTLSVWESEQALLDFVHEGPHLIAMASFQSDLRQTRFIRWNLNGRSCPPTWRDAHSRSSTMHAHDWTISSAS